MVSFGAIAKHLSPGGAEYQYSSEICLPATLGTLNYMSIVGQQTNEFAKLSVAFIHFRLAGGGLSSECSMRGSILNYVI